MDFAAINWSALEGAYKLPYDPSRAFKQLTYATSSEEIQTAFAGLWDNLHHQGEVGTASYVAVPELVRLCLDKKSLDWNFISLCVLIESCRLDERNPEVPAEFAQEYFDALANFERYLLVNFKNITDQHALRCTLALFAILHGQPGLGKAIHLLDEELLHEFLGND